jgi:hypothetical protein
LIARAGLHLFDRSGKALSFAARNSDAEPQNHEGEAHRHSGADKEILLVYWAFHGTILAENTPRYTPAGVTG